MILEVFVSTCYLLSFKFLAEIVRVTSENFTIVLERVK